VKGVKSVSADSGSRSPSIRTIPRNDSDAWSLRRWRPLLGVAVDGMFDREPPVTHDAPEIGNRVPPSGPNEIRLGPAERVRIRVSSVRQHANRREGELGVLDGSSGVRHLVEWPARRTCALAAPQARREIRAVLCRRRR
jgi:hypothetical protein